MNVHHYNIAGVLNVTIDKSTVSILNSCIFSMYTILSGSQIYYCTVNHIPIYS